MRVWYPEAPEARWTSTWPLGVPLVLMNASVLFTETTAFVIVVGCRSHASCVTAIIDGTSMIPIEFHVNIA